MTGTSHYELFQDDDQKWRWRLRAGNGEIVATSEAYEGGKKAAERGARDAKKASRGAHIKVID